MKILVLCHEHPPLGGGGGNAAAQIAKNLVKEGNTVALLTSHFADLPLEETVNGYRIQRLKIGRHAADGCNIRELITFMLSALSPAKKIVEQMNPEIIVSFFTLPSGYIALQLKKRYQIPYVISLRGGDVPGFLAQDLWLYHIFTKPLIRRIWQEAKTVVGNCQYLADLAKNTDSRIDYKVVPNGIDTELFKPAHIEHSGNICKLLFVGRIEKQKGLPFLFEALIRMKDLPWQVTLIGDGSQKNKMISLVKELNLSSRVEFVSWQSRENLIKYYQNADIFVFPSLDEGMPQAVREAMTCGLPVIATDVGGTKEIVHNRNNGIIIEPRNIDQLVSSLKELIENIELRKKLAEDARNTSLEWTWEKNAEQYLTWMKKQ